MSESSYCSFLGRPTKQYLICYKHIPGFLQIQVSYVVVFVVKLGVIYATTKRRRQRFERLRARGLID